MAIQSEWTREPGLWDPGQPDRPAPTGRRPAHDPQPREIQRPVPEGHHAACRSAFPRISATGARTRPSTRSPAKGARLTDIDGNEYIDYRLAYGPCILGYADPRVDAAARAGIEVGGVFALGTEREYAVAERIASMVPGGRTGALLELRHRGGDGGAAPRARLHRQGFLRRHRRRLPRRVRRRALDTPIEDWHPGHGDPHLVPYSAGVPAHAARADPRRADERRRPARERVQGLRRRDRRVPDRADHGQLLLDLGDARIPARRARALRQVRHPA